MLIKDMKTGDKFVFKNVLHIVSDQNWPGTRHKKVYDFNGRVWVFDEDTICKLVDPGCIRGEMGKEAQVKDLKLGTLVNLSWMLAQDAVVNIFTGETDEVEPDDLVQVYPEARFNVTL